MSENFISNENKSVVWQILVDNNGFSNISDEQFINVRNIFDSIFTEINNSNNVNSNSLVDKNKLAISEIMKKLSYMKTQKVISPLQEVKIDIEKAMENKQEEFLKLLQKPSLPDVNFSDNNSMIDNPISNDDMTIRLNNMINQRQTVFNMIPNTELEKKENTQESAQENAEKNTQENAQENAQEKQEKQEKKVTFSGNTEFLNKIKRSDIVNDLNTNNSNNTNNKESNNINISYINKILHNQNIIMNELSNIKQALKELK